MLGCMYVCVQCKLSRFSMNFVLLKALKFEIQNHLRLGNFLCRHNKFFINVFKVVKEHLLLDTLEEKSGYDWVG